MTLGFGLIGFIDDYIKLKKYSFKGLSGNIKIVTQSLIALFFSILLLKFSPESNTNLIFPIFKNLYFDIGYFWFIFSIFVIVGSSNAVEDFVNECMKIDIYDQTFYPVSKGCLVLEICLSRLYL